MICYISNFSKHNINFLQVSCFFFGRKLNIILYILRKIAPEWISLVGKWICACGFLRSARKAKINMSLPKLQNRMASRDTSKEALDLSRGPSSPWYPVLRAPSSTARLCRYRLTGGTACPELGLVEFEGGETCHVSCVFVCVGRHHGDHGSLMK